VCLGGTKVLFLHLLLFFDGFPITSKGSGVEAVMVTAGKDEDAYPDYCIIHIR